MLQSIFKKWWVLLLQGILLIILAFYVFNNPVEVLAGLSVWFGFLVLLAGILGIVHWVSSDKSDRDGITFLWCLVTVLFGFLMLLNLLATMKTLTILFGIWVLLTGIRLFQAGWSIKAGNPIGWLMVVVGALSVVAALMIVFNLGTGAVGISMLLGLQVMFTGIAMVVLSFVKKRISESIKNRVEELRSNPG